MNYHDFTIRIRERISGEYSVEASSPVRGETWGGLTLDPASQEVRRYLERLDGEITDESFLKEFGSFLFDSLFQGEVRDLFKESLGQARAVEGRGLRIKLDLRPPEVAFLPWEFLYDKRRDHFLAAHPATPLTRYISLYEPIRQLETSLPIRVLVVIPAASGLDTDKEKQILEEAFSELRSAVELEFLEGKVTPTVLSDALMREKYHILHFIGHGHFDQEEAYLDFNNDQGEREGLSGSRVAQFFLGYSSLKLVLLNVCQGAMVSATLPLVGLAPQLVRRGIPAVVAMRYPVPDDVAILFAREFYRKLCIGPERGRLDTAICHARNRLWMEYPGDRHVGTPVLFLRSPEGIIFDIRAKGQDSDTWRLIRDTHRYNLAIIEEEEKKGRISPEQQEEKTATIDAIRLVQRILRWRRISVIGVALLLFIASWVGLFNVLGLDENVERILVHLGNHLSPPAWDDSIVVVAEDRESKDALRLTDRSALRAYHAKVLPKLATAGARVIALDYIYETPSRHDHNLAQAIREARRRGSTVIVGVRNFDENPNLVRELKEVVSAWGEVKNVLGSVGGYVRKMRLVELTDEKDTLARFFGLQVVYHGLGARGLKINKQETLISLYNGFPKEIPILQMTSRETGKGIPHPSTETRRGERRAEIYVRFSPMETLKQHTFSYQRLWNRLEEPADSPFWENFRDKLVLLGNTLPGVDEHFIYPGEKRSGVHIVADGINTILQEQYITPVSTRRHLSILMLMAGMGFFLRLRFPPDKKIVSRGILLGLVLLYLAAVLFMYTHLLIIPDVAYHLMALLLTYWMLGPLRRRWA